MKREATKFTQSTGFSLLENLISIIVIAVGLLGMAKLQVLSLRDMQASRNLTAATILARDMAERLRVGGTAVHHFDFSALPSASPPCFGVAAKCDDSTFFRREYSSWRAAVGAQLPGGQGIVCRDTSPNDGTVAAPNCSGGATAPLVVKVWWSEKNSRYPGAIERFVMPLVARDGLMQ